MECRVVPESGLDALAQQREKESCIYKRGKVQEAEEEEEE